MQGSTSTDKIDGQSVADEADDVPDVPIPVSGPNPNPYLYEDPEQGDSIPLQDLGDGFDEMDYKEPDIDSKEQEMPLSPKVIVRQTSV